MGGKRQNYRTSLEDNYWRRGEFRELTTYAHIVWDHLSPASIHFFN
jgi:hypothetical protein